GRPASPVVAVLGQGRKAARPAVAFAHFDVQRGARGGGGFARGTCGGPGGGQALGEVASRALVAGLGHHGGGLRLDLGEFGGEAGDGVVERLRLGLPPGGFALQPFDRRAGLCDLLLGEGRLAAGQPLGLLGGLHAGGGGGLRVARRLRLGRQLLDVGLDLGQARLLLHAYGRGLLGLGLGGEAVPAPEVALARDQAAAWGEHALQPLAVLARRDGGEGEAGGERRRCADQRGERATALRPSRRGRLGAAPEDGGIAVEGRLQIVAQGGGQGDLVAAFRTHLLQGRGEAAAPLWGDDLGQRPRLGGQAAELFVQLAGRLAAFEFGGARRGALLLGRLHGGAGRGEGGLGPGEFGASCLGFRRDRRAQALALSLGLVERAAGAREAVLRLLDAGAGGPAARLLRRMLGG